MSAIPFLMIAVLCGLFAVSCYRDFRRAERRCDLLAKQRDEALKAIDTYRSACETNERTIENYRGIVERYEAIMRGTR